MIILDDFNLSNASYQYNPDTMSFVRLSDRIPEEGDIVRRRAVGYGAIRRIGLVRIRKCFAAYYYFEDNLFFACDEFKVNLCDPYTEISRCCIGPFMYRFSIGDPILFTFNYWDFRIDEPGGYLGGDFFNYVCKSARTAMSRERRRFTLKCVSEGVSITGDEFQALRKKKFGDNA